MGDRIPFLEASGTTYEVGLKLGEFSQAVLGRFIDSPAAVADREKIKAEPRILSRSLRAAADRYPQYMDEMRGIADGAGRSLQDIFIFNWRPRPRGAARSDRSDSSDRSDASAHRESCTTLIVPAEYGVLLAHNEDWFTGANDVFLARLRYEGGFDGIAICYHGFLPGLSASLNQYGLAQSLNNLISSDCGAGVALALIDRAALDATSVDEAIKIVTQAGRADSENFNFAQRRRAVYVELSARDFALVEVTKPAAHTNHYVAERMLALEANPRLDSTRHRLARATAMLAAKTVPGTVLGPENLKAILSSHEDAPWCICRHLRRGGAEAAAGSDQSDRSDRSDAPGPRDYGVTLATAVIDTAARTFDVCIGNPCTAPFRQFTL